MHPSAYRIGRDFFNIYWRKGFRSILEIGSCDINGSLRDFRPEGALYIGVDLEPGKGVDLVKPLNGPIPIADASIDVVVCTSVLEHDPFFWVTTLELARITRPGGLIYLNAPSNGWFHLHPDDCWRFYPDAGVALVRWAGYNGLCLALIESFVAEQSGDVWNDFVAVLAREPAPEAPPAFLHDRIRAYNVRKLGVNGRLRVRHESQDMVRISELTREVAALRAELVERRSRAGTKTKPSDGR
mgnify:CR=1 FL=1